MSTLHLPLKGEYFDQIKAGTKPEEFRLANDICLRPRNAGGHQKCSKKRQAMRRREKEKPY